MKKILPIIVLLIIVGGAVSYFTLNSDNATVSNLTISNNERAKGNPDAKVVIVEYIDFQCPACAFMNKNWVEIWRIISPDVEFISRHYPLPFHTHSRLASTFVEAANLQGKFWEMHDIFFEKQKEWSVLGASKAFEYFVSYADEIGIDTVQLKKDLEEKKSEFESKINSDIASGNQIGVQGTPSIYINNVKINNPSSPQVLLNIVKESIEANP